MKPDHAMPGGCAIWRRCRGSAAKRGGANRPFFTISSVEIDDRYDHVSVRVDDDQLVADDDIFVILPAWDVPVEGRRNIIDRIIPRHEPADYDSPRNAIDAMEVTAMTAVVVANPPAIPIRNMDVSAIVLAPLTRLAPVMYPVLADVAAVLTPIFACIAAMIAAIFTGVATMLASILHSFVAAGALVLSRTAFVAPDIPFLMTDAFMPPGPLVPLRFSLVAACIPTPLMLHVLALHIASFDMSSGPFAMGARLDALLGTATRAVLRMSTTAAVAALR